MLLDIISRYGILQNIVVFYFMLILFYDVHNLMTKYNYLPVSEYFTNRNIHCKLYIIFQYYLPTLYRYL